MTKPALKVAITGAAGHIGYALLFRIAAGEMFGTDQPVILHLIELESGMDALAGVVMEINDCAFPLVQGIVATSDLDEGFAAIDWAILVGAVPRKAGMERKDLLEINAKVFVSQGQSLNRVAKRDAKVLVVGNPCNTNCLIAMHNAPDLPKENFYAMTMLDELRARHQLSDKLGVHIGEIDNLIVWGNHSATQYPDAFNAHLGGQRIGDKVAQEYIANEFVPRIRQRGAEVIKVRGASSAASAANAIIETVARLTPGHPHANSKVFSVARYSAGEFGIPAGLIVSMPCYMENGTLEVDIDGSWEQSEWSTAQIASSYAELMAEAKAVADAGYINLD